VSVVLLVSRVSVGAVIHGVGQITSAFLTKCGPRRGRCRWAALRRGARLNLSDVCVRYRTGPADSTRLLRSGNTHHPAVVEEAIKRSQSIQLDRADRVTAFAGSMSFVWIHAALFAVWVLLLKRSPWQH
jgi:hypothetical protein